MSQVGGGHTSSLEMYQIEWLLPGAAWSGAKPRSPRSGMWSQRAGSKRQKCPCVSVGWLCSLEKENGFLISFSYKCLAVKSLAVDPNTCHGASDLPLVPSAINCRQGPGRYNRCNHPRCDRTLTQEWSHQDSNPAAASFRWMHWFPMRGFYMCPYRKAPMYIFKAIVTSVGAWG